MEELWFLGDIGTRSLLRVSHRMLVLFGTEFILIDYNARARLVYEYLEDQSLEQMEMAISSSGPLSNRASLDYFRREVAVFNLPSRLLIKLEKAFLHKWAFPPISLCLIYVNLMLFM